MKDLAQLWFSKFVAAKNAGSTTQDALMHADIAVALAKADLSGADLSGACLRGTDLTGAKV